MLQHFYKYHGTGNDFVILNGWTRYPALTPEQIRHICDRHFGIGADGIMVLLPSEKYDFKMLYYNSDGNPGSMCGNGGRCLAHFAVQNGYAAKQCTFEASDGIHKTTVDLQHNNVSLGMRDVNGIQTTRDGSCILNTGSPHYITWKNPLTTNVFAEGKLIRNSPEFIKEGINVNFVEVEKNILKIRTYERGVENETLSCGTGITAAVLAAAYCGKIPADLKTVNIIASGGKLKVSFNRKEDTFTDIFLEGPAIKVFEGFISL